MAKKNAPNVEDDLLGGTPAAGDDLLGGDPAADKPAGKKAPAKKAAKPAAKADKPAAKTAAAKPAKADKPAKEAKAAPAKKGARAVGVKGQGKFFFPVESDEFKDLRKKLAAKKGAISTKEAAEAYSTDTWKVRLVMAHMVNKEGKGTLEKTGNVLVYTP